MKTMTDFLQKYPTFTHFVLIVWNAFFTSWATKISVPLDGLGIPLTINANAIVTWMQMHLHVPTIAVGVLTFILNAIMAYVSWKKKCVPVPPVDVPAKPTDAAIAMKQLETKDASQATR